MKLHPGTGEGSAVRYKQIVYCNVPLHRKPRPQAHGTWAKLLHCVPCPYNEPVCIYAAMCV